MTRALHNTKYGIQRRIDAALGSGLYVVGIGPDGTVLTAHSPPDPDRREVAAALTAAPAIGEAVS
jgi:hypothetical protein